MRQSTTLILGLTILGATSGCTMFGNPLSRTDPAEAARERQASEISAMIARGDYEGAQRLMDSMQASAAPVASSVFDQTHTLKSEAEREKMIGQLLASQPAEHRELLRQKYSQIGTARLEELVAMDNELRGIGQGSVPEPSIPTLVQDPSIQLAGNQQQTGQNAGVTQAQNRQPGQQTPNDGFGIGFPQRQNANELHAPDPRPQGAGPSTQTLPDSTPNGEAPRLPDGLNFGVSQAGHLGAGPGSIQPVAGTQPHTAAYPTDSQAIGQAGFSSNQQGATRFPAPRGTDSGNQLPVITPGNSELRTGAPSQYPGTSQNPFPQSSVGSPYGQQGVIQPTAGYADQLPPSSGGVTLKNQIEVGSGTISGSATTQIGGTLNPFPLPGQQTAGSQTSGLNAGFDPGTVPGGLTAPLTGTQPGTGPLPGNVAQNGQPGTEPPADQSLIPGVFRGGIETFRNATATVTERGLRTFGAIGDDGTSAPSATQPLAMSPQPESVDDLIARIESELARTAPGDTEIERLNHVRKQVNLRMLYLIADRIDQSIEPITAAEPADQEFWQQLFFAYVNYFDAQQMPQASDRATQTIDQLRTAVAKLRHRADLKLKNVTFCHHIVSFGDYERFSADQFTPGQPLLLYSEVENFFSTRTDTDRYRTVLQSQIEIYDNSNMQRPVVTIPFDPSEDICRNHRRDFFHSYEFTVPQDLQPGLYTLVLRVTDQLSQKVATSRLNFRVE